MKLLFANGKREKSEKRTTPLPAAIRGWLEKSERQIVQIKWKINCKLVFVQLENWQMKCLPKHLWSWNVLMNFQVDIRTRNIVTIKEMLFLREYEQL